MDILRRKLDIIRVSYQKQKALLTSKKREKSCQEVVQVEDTDLVVVAKV